MKGRVGARPPARRRRPAGPRVLRVSVVGYLNTAPLVWGLERGAMKRRYRLSYTTPAGCAEDLRAGRADIGIIPVIAYQEIPGLRVIPRVAIASERKVESVLLVSRGPARRAKRVALDRSSRTSAALVQILYTKLWGGHPEYVPAAPDLVRMLEEADAALVIGDPALRFTLHAPDAPRPAPANLHVYDLAEEWYRLTHLPFVFAFWAVRATAVGGRREREQLVHDFQRSRAEGLEHLTEIAHEAASLRLPGGQLERYLRYSIDYRLDAPQRGGLELFYRYARELGLMGEMRPLEYV